MALIILYLLASILIFIGVEPFKTIGIFLIICYLPGFLVFAFSKKDKLLFEDLILACACAIGISSILILVLLFAGIHVRYIPYVIHSGVGIGILLFIIINKRKRVHLVVDVTKQEIIFSLFALIVTLLLSIPSFLGPRYDIASHAFFHSSIVMQVLNGIFPPENPGLGGTPVWYYWGFHTLIATLTAQSNFQQIQVMFALNILLLYMLFCISYIFAKALNFLEGYRYIVPLAVIGLMRSDAGIIFMVRLISGNIMPLGNMTTYPIETYDIMKNWTGELPWFDSRLYFLNKYYNVSGMPIAIFLCLAYFFPLFQVLKEKVIFHKIYFISIGIIIVACFINYPPIAFIPLIHAPVWVFYIYLSNKRRVKEKFKETLKIFLPYAVAVLMVIPYLLFISKGGSEEGSKVISLDFYSQSLKNIIVFLLPLPLIFSGMWIAIKCLTFSRELFFLLIGTLLCLVLSIFTRLPMDNSYKFNFILTFFLALFFVFTLSRWLPLIANRWIKRVSVIGIISYLLLTPIITEASFIASSLYNPRKYSFSERHILYAEDKQKNEAYTWIRENTPPNALIMLSYVETNWPCCGLNNNYESAAIAERVLYVITDKDFTTSNPEFKKRIWFRNRLFENSSDPDVINYFTLLNRPVYLLIDETLPEERFFVEDRFKYFPENPAPPFLLVFRNDKQRVYLIQYKK